MTRLRDMLIEHEGLRLKPYQCPAGKLTIGVGRNIEDNGISRDEAMLLLDNDIARCRRELSSLPWFAGLGEVRQAVLIDMNFNLGLNRFMGFRKTLVAVAAGDYTLASKEMIDSTWAKQVGARADRLARMMRTGEW